MKIHQFTLAICVTVFAESVLAGSIACNGTIIADDQRDAQFKQQILDQCGQPTSMEDDDWIYDRSDVGQGIYVLHFNDNGQLDSIEERKGEE